MAEIQSEANGEVRAGRKRYGELCNAAFRREITMLHKC